MLWTNGGMLQSPNFILWEKLTIMRCRRITMYSVFCAKMLTGSYDNSKIISITVRNFTWLQCFIINEHLNRFSLLSIFLIYLEKVLRVPLEFIWEGNFLFIYIGDRISLCSFSWPKTYLIDQADKELRDLLTDLQRVLGLKAYTTAPSVQIFQGRGNEILLHIHNKMFLCNF